MIWHISNVITLHNNIFKPNNTKKIEPSKLFNTWFSFGEIWSSAIPRSSHTKTDSFNGDKMWCGCLSACLYRSPS